MMLLVCFPLLFWLDEPLRLPAEFESANFFWEDVDADGLNDVWVRTDQNELWLWNGRQEDANFSLLAQSQEFTNMRPAQSEQGIVASAYAPGIIFYQKDGAWSVWDNLDEFTSRRRLGYAYEGGLFILPTPGGYLRQRPTCEPISLDVKPTLNRQDDEMRIVYPVPHHEQRIGAYWYLPPVIDHERGRLSVQVLDENSSFKSIGNWVSFPTGMAIAKYAYGDLNRDGWIDLAVLTRPAKDFSLFDELSLVVVLGKGPGEFEDHTLVQLKSEQNLWQSGPLTIEPGALVTHYYKGLIRAKFRRDVYNWDEAGFVEPEPKTMKWKVEDADRGSIAVDLDMGGDARPDLLLVDNHGLRVHVRTGSERVEAFDENPITLKFSSNSGFSVHITAGSGGSEFELDSDLAVRNRFRGRGGHVLVVTGKQAVIWELADFGDHIQLQALPRASIQRN